jgi:hypothetical protein
MGSGISPSLLPPRKIFEELFTYKKQRLRVQTSQQGCKREIRFSLHGHISPIYQETISQKSENTILSIYY